MNIKIYTFFLCVFFAFSCISSKEIKCVQSNDFYLEIRQTVFGAYEQQMFVFAGNELHIFQERILKNGLIKRKEVYFKKINNKVKIDDIKDKSEKIENLESEYISAQLDGLRWEIFVKEGKSSQKVIIENMSIKEINALFEAINVIIPPNKPKLYKY